MKPIYQNAQWQVTSKYLESPENDYWIPLDDVAQVDYNGDFYHWPIHMAQKVWVDPKLFLQAWAVAMHEQQHVTPRPDWMVTTVYETIAERGERAEARDRIMAAALKRV